MLDRVLNEFENRLSAHTDWFNSMQALDCTSESFLEWSQLQMFAKKYSSHFNEVDMANLKNQAATAQN